MGLGFNHRTADSDWSTCCPHWAFDGFGLFRRRLAEAEGLDLEEMQGYGKYNEFGNHVPGARSWDEIDTPLKPLLDHSDCDGELTPEECAQVFPRLRKILEGWDLDDPGFHYDYRSGLRLADCMEACTKAGEKLEFC